MLSLSTPMVQAIINVDDHTNQVLNIIKAKFGLKDKSQAIQMMAQEYEGKVLEPELRPEYIQRLQSIKKEPRIHFKNMSELRRRIDNA